MTSSLCDAPWKCDRACMLELNLRLQTSHLGFSWLFTESVVVFLTAAALQVLIRADVGICESAITWSR